MGIVGAVILTGAMIAVFYYENSNAGDSEDILGTGENLYTIIWQEETHPATSDGNKFTDGETLGSAASATYDVSIPNYTSEITVTLQWTDNVAPSANINSEDTFRVELLDPSGTVLADDEDASGEITLSYTVPEGAPVAGTPSPTTVQARGNTTTDAENAVKQAAGAATYQLRVTLVNTNSQVPPLAPVGADDSNDFTVYLGYTHWHAWEENNPVLAA